MTMEKRYGVPKVLNTAYDQGLADGIRQERERIREALLKASYSYEVADRFNFLHPDKDSEEYIEIVRPVTIGTIHAAAEILLDHIGLGAVEESEK